MISLDQFYGAYKSIRPLPDPDQRDAIEETSGKPLFIVAGPGTGKTTCLTLRILKLILIDGVPPGGILATTFTKKAAIELRSRVLGWGFGLLEALQSNKAINRSARERLARVDINHVLTGTIDSICEQVLHEFRDPGTIPAVLVDEFVSRTLMLREGLFGNGRFRDDELDRFLFDKSARNSRYGWNIGAKNDLLQTIWDRRFQDQLDWDAFLRSGPKNEKRARQQIGDIFNDYQQSLVQDGRLDFALLEQEVLSRLRAGQLSEFASQLRVVLVDEYQDTNLLQEAIYFELAKACKGGMTVVGDDDQSLYRFRGATVELFSEYERRYRRAFGRMPRKIFLRTNYRSTGIIRRFVNGYITLEGDYQSVRVQGKPQLEPPKQKVDTKEELPILGMFRDGMSDLAKDLADLIHRVFAGKGYRLPTGQLIRANTKEGAVGDCALLCSSPAEFSSGGKERLPLLLRRELGARRPPVEMFNPRGQDLTGIQVIRVFGGLLLECLDPGATLQTDIRSRNHISDDIRGVFDDWRHEAIAFAEGKGCPDGLRKFAMAWAGRDPKRKGHKWAHAVPVLELIYGLVHFFPELHDDPEGQIYLEVFTRQVSACEQVGKFSGRVLTEPTNPGLSEASVKELLRDFLGPIAAGTVKVNEDLTETFPRDRLSVLSIHQAKGLEFPLTIVDVGSDFSGNYPAQAFKRFPTNGSQPHVMEDLLRPYTDLAAPARSAVYRAFDDLWRQFFVAYSRAQDVLLLVGLTTILPGRWLPNVATGYRRDGSCPWGSKFPFLTI